VLYKKLTAESLALIIVLGVVASLVAMCLLLAVVEH